MAYYSRSVRRLAKKSRRKLIFTILLTALLGYAAIFWILPTFVGGIGFISGILRPPSKTEQSAAENPTVAPPILSIPFDSTNSQTLSFKGYSTGVKVKIYVDDELRDTVDVEEDDSFEVKNLELRFGTNNIYGKSVDEKDQESLPSKTVKVDFDNIKPLLEVNELEDGKSIQGERRLKVSGKTDAGVHIFVNGTQVIVQSDGSFSHEISLNDGENTISVKAQDKALNEIEITRKVNFTP